MPEAGATYVPRPLDEVASDPMTEALRGLLSLIGDGRVIDGLELTYDALTAHIAPGQAIVITDDDPASAYYVKLTLQVNELLVNAATNRIYLTFDGEIVVNQTGIQPASSIHMYTVVTAGGVVTGTPTTHWTSLIDIGAAIRVLGLDLNGATLTNMGNPSAGTDGVNYQTLLSLLGASGLVKTARAATTAALPANTYANGSLGVGATLTANANGALPNQDGVVLAVGDRLFVKDEASGLKNGVFTVTQLGSGGTPYILTRATDYDTTGEILPGSMVVVAEGTTLLDSLWMLTTNGAIVVGTTALAFARRDVAAHAAETAIGVHGSTAAPTASTLMHRDAQSRSQIEEGASDKDITNLKQVQQVALFQAGLYGGM